MRCWWIFRTGIGRDFGPNRHGRCDHASRSGRLGCARLSWRRPGPSQARDRRSRVGRPADDQRRWPADHLLHRRNLQPCRASGGTQAVGEDAQAIGVERSARRRNAARRERWLVHGSGTDVGAGVVQDYVLEMHAFAVDPQRGAGVGKMRSLDPSFPDAFRYRSSPPPLRRSSRRLPRPAERRLRLRDLG